jgi:hypothetical protein
MDFKIFAGLITVILAVISYGFYLGSVATKQTKPHVYSWLLWSILAGVGFIGQISDKAGPGAWNTGITAIACFTVFVVSLRYGDKYLSKKDKFLLGLAFIAVFVQILTSNHNIAVTLATLTALIGFFFTLKKAYIKPFEDSWPTFFINANRNLISLFALSTISYLTFFYPFMMMLANISVVVMILARKKLILKSKKSAE